MNVIIILLLFVYDAICKIPAAFTIVFVPDFIAVESTQGNQGTKVYALILCFSTTATVKTEAAKWGINALAGSMLGIYFCFRKLIDKEDRLPQFRTVQCPKPSSKFLNQQSFERPAIKIQNQSTFSFSLSSETLEKTNFSRVYPETNCLVFKIRHTTKSVSRQLPKLIQYLPVIIFLNSVQHIRKTACRQKVCKFSH